jgi:hypothetical protein
LMENVNRSRGRPRPVVPLGVVGGSEQRSRPVSLRVRGLDVGWTRARRGCARGRRDGTSVQPRNVRLLILVSSSHLEAERPGVWCTSGRPQPFVHATDGRSQEMHSSSASPSARSSFRACRKATDQHARHLTNAMEVRARSVHSCGARRCSGPGANRGVDQRAVRAAFGCT